MGDKVWYEPGPPFEKSSDFGPRVAPKKGSTTGSSDHKGIDLRAPKGTDIPAADAGVVVKSGVVGGYGKTVIVAHYDNLASKSGLNGWTLYAHMSRTSVKAGEVVESGDKLGEVGKTGDATGHHLHFETRLPSGDSTNWGKGTPVDPDTFGGWGSEGSDTGFTGPLLPGSDGTVATSGDPVAGRGGPGTVGGDDAGSGGVSDADLDALASDVALDHAASDVIGETGNDLGSDHGADDDDPAADGDSGRASTPGGSDATNVGSTSGMDFSEYTVDSYGAIDSSLGYEPVHVLAFSHKPSDGGGAPGGPTGGQDDGGSDGDHPTGSGAPSGVGGDGGSSSGDAGSTVGADSESEGSLGSDGAEGSDAGDDSGVDLDPSGGVPGYEGGHSSEGNGGASESEDADDDSSD